MKDNSEYNRALELRLNHINQKIDETLEECRKTQVKAKAWELRVVSPSTSEVSDLDEIMEKPVTTRNKSRSKRKYEELTRHKMSSPHAHDQVEDVRRKMERQYLKDKA